MKIKITILLFLAIAGTGGDSLIAQPNSGGNSNKNVSLQMLEFRQDMRMLWEDHIVWTRNVILNILDDLPGTNQAVGRLLQNQVDIGNAIKPYYGNAAGNQLTALLTGHIVIAADLLTALKNNDASALTTANQNWIDNADSIALFLSGANPLWSFADLQMMMHDHLNLTASEAVARKTQDYASDVIVYDAVHMEILEMADMLSEGIIRQFPSQFHGNNRDVNLYIELTGSEVQLKQNSPNPFSGSTVIDYYLPDYVSGAAIQFYNSSGSLIRTVTLVETGQGSLHINANDLKSGIYSYSIVVDGRVLDTKMMMK